MARSPTLSPAPLAHFGARFAGRTFAKSLMMFICAFHFPLPLVSPLPSIATLYLRGV